jgi:hypothetical protein
MLWAMITKFEMYVLISFSGLRFLIFQFVSTSIFQVTQSYNLVDEYRSEKNIKEGPRIFLPIVGINLADYKVL